MSEKSETSEQWQGSPSMHIVTLHIWRIFQWSSWPFLMPCRICSCLSPPLSSSFFFFIHLCSLLICFLNLWPVSLFYVPSSENLLSPLPFPPAPLVSLKAFSWHLSPDNCFPGSAFQLHKAPCGPYLQVFSCIFLLSFGSYLICSVWILQSNGQTLLKCILGHSHPPWPPYCSEMADDTSFFFSSCQFQWIFHFWGLFQIMGIHFYFSSTNISWISPLKGSLCCQWETYRLSGSQG